MSHKNPPVDVSVVLPTFNEGQNIEALVTRTQQALKNYSHEVIVVDDDSPDKTWEIAEKLKQRQKTDSIRVIRRINEKKLVSAIQRGIDEARGSYVVWMDADLSMPPELIPEMVAHLNEYSIAIGSRYAKGGKDARPMIRILSSWCINKVAYVMLKRYARDYDSGFVAARKEVLNDIRLSDSGYGEYCIEFLYRAGKGGYKIKEIPYSFIDRRAGQSKTAETLYGLFKYGMLYFRRIVRLRFKG